MTAESFAPVVETAHGDGETQGRVPETFRGTQLQVEGDALEVVVVGFHLSTEVTGNGRDAEVEVFVEIVSAEIDTDGE